MLMTTARLQIPPRRTGARPQVILLASALVLWSIFPLAQAPLERLGDKDVKKLIDQVDEGRDKFEGNLEGGFKGSTVQGPNGETKVAAVLQDYQDNTKKLQSRFSPDYAAGPEVATVLKQATSIDRFMKGSPSTMKGRSEWDRHEADLKRLAEAYGTTFPLPDGASVRRMNDKEPRAAAADIASAGGRFKSDLDKAKTLPKADKDAAKKDADVLIKHAKTVKDRISGGKPATSDVRLLVEQVAKLQTFVGAHEIPTTNWQAVQTSLAKVQEAFGLTK
jgi:hypothetical protein